MDSAPEPSATPTHSVVNVGRDSPLPTPPAHLSVATFNCYIGSALPFTPNFTPLLRASGAGAPRLQRQLRAVAARLPDVLALQELHHCPLGDAYAAAFPTHALHRDRRCNPAGALVLALALLLLGAFVAGVARAAGALCGAAAAAAVAAALLSEALAVPIAFLTGRTRGGLGLLLRRGRLAARASETVTFATQTGDILNLLKPRGFQQVLVELLPARAEGAAEGAPPRLLLLLHTHASLGTGAAGEALRQAQLRELAAAASPAGVAALLARAGLTGRCQPEDVPALVVGDFNAEWDSAGVQGSLGAMVDAWGAAWDGQGPGATWDNERNALTRGVLNEPTARVDLVLYAPPARRGGPLALAAAAAAIHAEEEPTSDHFMASCVFRVVGGEEGEAEGAPGGGASGAARIGSPEGGAKQGSSGGEGEDAGTPCSGAERPRRAESWDSLAGDPEVLPRSGASSPRGAARQRLAPAVAW